MKLGTKKEVFYADEAMRTSGGLLKKDLRLNAKNKVVSIKRSEASKANIERLKPFRFKKKT